MTLSPFVGMYCAKNYIGNNRIRLVTDGNYMLKTTLNYVLKCTVKDSMYVFIDARW